MTERKQRWLARSFFVTLLGLIPLGLLIWSATLKVHNTKTHWLWYGYMHNAFQGVLAVLSYIVVFTGAAAIAMLAVVFVVLSFDRNEGWIPKLWRCAWKRS